MYRSVASRVKKLYRKEGGYIGLKVWARASNDEDAQAWYQNKRTKQPRKPKQVYIKTKSSLDFKADKKGKK